MLDALMLLMASVNTVNLAITPSLSVTWLADSCGRCAGVVRHEPGLETYDVPGVACGVTFAGRWVWGGAE